MEKYIIDTQPDSETALKKFEAVKRVAKAKNAYYPLTKKWFLKAYPDFKKEGITDEESANASNAVVAGTKRETP